jgi:hypothetical protein
MPKLSESPSSAVNVFLIGMIEIVSSWIDESNKPGNGEGPEPIAHPKCRRIEIYEHSDGNPNKTN